MAMFTDVDPLTPLFAIHATANENNTAITIMNIGPGLDALIKLGQSVPVR